MKNSAKNAKIYVGVDIGGTNLRISFSDHTGIISRVKTPTLLLGDNSAIPNQIINIVNDISLKIEVSTKNIEAIGVSACSPFKTIDGDLALVGSNLCGGLTNGMVLSLNDWEFVPIGRELKKIKCTTILQNDAQALVMAERIFGAAKGENHCILVTWGTGIGFGIVADGHLIKGKNRNAGHAGHQFVAEDTEHVCGCGNIGDLESLISGKSLEKEYGEPAKSIFKNYRKGHAKAKEIVNLAAYRFARALYNVAVAFDTKLIVIGGGVFLNNDDILLPKIKNEFYKHLQVLTSEIEICRTSLGEFAGDLAALSLVIPKNWYPFWRTNEIWKKAPLLNVL